MKDTIRKILDIQPTDFNYDFDPTLEDVLVAIYKLGNIEADIIQISSIVAQIKYDLLIFYWQLTKTFTQQTLETQLIIKQIFEDGKTN